MKKENPIQNRNKPKEKYPYRLFYKVFGGEPRRIDETVNAVHSAQALAIFRAMYPKVRDYASVGEVWVELDNEEYKRRQDLEKSRQEDQQRQLQNAWWQ